MCTIVYYYYSKRVNYPKAVLQLQQQSSRCIENITELLLSLYPPSFLLDYQLLIVATYLLTTH